MVEEATALGRQLQKLRAQDRGQAYTTHLEVTERVSAGALAPQLGSLQHGDHFCSFYETAREQLDIVAPFFSECLKRGEACLYVADDRTAPEVSAALEAVGIDVAEELGRGALTFVNKWAWRNAGDFDIPTMAEGVRDLTHRILAPGFAGVWVAVDMTWALDPDIAPEHLAEWESFWNSLLRELPVVLLCQYNRWRLPPETLHRELKTHPMAILGAEVYPNFFYEPPEVFLSKTDHLQRVNWMFEQLRLTTAVEEERTRRIRTEIMLKEIHHRIKNSLQIAASLLALQAGQIKHPASVEALFESEARLRTIATVHDALQAIGEKTYVDFADYLRDMIPRIAQVHRARNPDVQVDIRAAEILLDPDTAVPCALILNELVTNALRHSFADGGEGRIVVELALGEDRQVSLTVQHEGAPSPGNNGERGPMPLGLQLVEALAQQIGAEMRIAGGAAGVTIVFPTPPDCL